MTGLSSVRLYLGCGAAVSALALLGACGGGVSSTPAPTPVPTPVPTPTPPAPAPTPTPTPTPAPIGYAQPPLPIDTIGFNDSEFRNSEGPKFHGAATAWVAGHTGQGSIIGLIDSGIHLAEPELAGRISADSYDIFSSRNTVEAENDHGTFVALTAAAGNNSAGTVGIAYSSTILAIRADEPGSCAAADGCAFGDMRDAINYAVDHNATVINMSLGGESVSAGETAALRRASEAGIIVVVSAGNQGRTADGDNPDPFPLSMVGKGFENVIIAGSVTASGDISSFSNRAGTGQSLYLAALGSSVSLSIGGQFFSVSGTSFSAPQIAGAVALLKEAFPSLTGAQVVHLLFETAQDAGAPGVDATYGHGILDIRRAFQPVGSTSLAGKGTAAFPLGDTAAVGSPAMGDALHAMAFNTLVLDKYQRAFSTDIGVTMRGAAFANRLYDAVGSRTRYVSTGGGAVAAAFTIDDAHRHPGGDPSASPMSLTMEDAEVSRVLAARIAFKLSPEIILGFTYAEGTDGLAMQLQGQDRPAFMIARQSGGDDGTYHRSEMSFALRRQFGAWGLTLTGTSGKTLSGDRVWLANTTYGGRTDDAVRHLGLTFDRHWGGLQATLGLDWMSEDRTVLGARFHEAFGGGGAETMFVDATASWEFAPGLRLAGALRNGWTYPATSSVIEPGSVIQSRAWSLDLERRGVFGKDDRIALRVSQPLRVERGGLNLSLPVSYSYDTQSASFGTMPLSLAPDGRELMGELAWSGALWGGGASASLFYRREPGHYEALPDDKGAALRWRKQF